MQHTRKFEIAEDLYPFESSWFEREGSVMHYLDVGEGMPVLMLHGNPTWSFLYRDVIQGLLGACRCIAPDYPGFGLSGHPEGYGYTPQEHADWVNALLEHLGIEEYILVVQDWGGPIGLSNAVENPDAIQGLLLANTWAWPLPWTGNLFSMLVGGPLGRRAHLQHNFFARRILPRGIAHKERKIPEILKAYTDPFPDEASRTGTYVFPWALRHSVTWLSAIEHRLYRLRDKPVELVWGMKDPLLGNRKVIRTWQKYFPHGEVTEVADANHFIQEDAAGEMANAIERLLERV